MTCQNGQKAKEASSCAHGQTSRSTKQKKLIVFLLLRLDISTKNNSNACKKKNILKVAACYGLLYPSLHV